MANNWNQTVLRTPLLLAGFVLGFSAVASHAQTEVDNASPGKSAAMPVPDDEGAAESSESDEMDGAKTLGGRQFWGDVAFFRGWRIQKNVFTNHYRLIDPQDARHASGSLDACRTEMDDVRRRLKLEPMSGRAVIFIHGIARSSKSFATMKKAMVNDHDLVIGFDYPSTRIPISESAEHLHQMIESLEGVERIDFVVHSMGGLLVRAYLREHRDPHIHRMVMLGVPNLGARMANLLKGVPGFRFILGPAGQQLIEDPAGYIAALPTPDFPFAVIAGARGTPGGFNPLIPGDDDGTVSVAATRLPGAADFATVGSLHSFLMSNPDVIAMTRRFLRENTLRESGVAEPIPIPVKPANDSTTGAGTP